MKKLNLLSFGEEAEEEEKELAAVKQKIKSSHDVLNDPRLLKPESTNKERNASDLKEVLSVREALDLRRKMLKKRKAGLYPIQLDIVMMTMMVETRLNLMQR